MRRNSLFPLAMLGVLGWGLAFGPEARAALGATPHVAATYSPDDFVTDPEYLNDLDALTRLLAAIADAGTSDRALFHRETPLAVSLWHTIDALLQKHGGFDEERTRAAGEIDRMQHAPDPATESLAANDAAGALTELYGISTTSVPEGTYRLPFLLRSVRFHARDKDWSGAAAVAEELSNSWNDVTTAARDRGVAVSYLTPLDTATGALPGMIARRDLRSIELAVPVDLASVARVRKVLASTTPPAAGDEAP